MKTKRLYSESTPVTFTLKIAVFVVAIVFFVGCSERDSRGSGVVAGDSGSNNEVAVQTDSPVASSTTVAENIGSDESDTDSGDGDSNLDDGGPGGGDDDGDSLDGDSDAIVGDDDSEGTEDEDGGGAVGEVGVEVPGGWEELISPEFVRGGLVLLPEPSMPLELVNEIVDLCDDSVAFLLANRRNLAPGETPTAKELDEVWMERNSRFVNCETEGGRRYTYVGRNSSVSKAEPTVAEAIAARDRIYPGRRKVDKPSRFPGGKLLGTFGLFDREFPLEERDEVVVLADTVNVSDGVVRGLVHNLSEVFYARDVVVEVDGLSWWWPLTLQPGERAPFEIAGWNRSDDPIQAGLQVTANMSTTLDLSRSFDMGENRWKPERDDEYVLISGHLITPTAPAGLDELVKQQTIEDLRSYSAIIDLTTGTVVDVTQHLLAYPVWHNDGTVSDPRTVLVDSYPVTADALPKHHTLIPDRLEPFLSGIEVENYSNFDIQVWFGGANPPPTQQTPTDSQTTESS